MPYTSLYVSSENLALNRFNHDPPVDNFLNSHHIFILHCVDIVTRRCILITSGSERVKGYQQWYNILYNLALKMI